MDADRFDAMARSLANTTSRRGSLAAMLGLAAEPVAATAAGRDKPRHHPRPSCRFPGVPCEVDADCCDESTCDGGTCRCADGLTQCGDFCVEDPLAGNFDCCKPYRTPCSPSDQVPCCSDSFRGSDSCVQWREDEFVCCGLYFHPCTPEDESYCCSGRCGANGRCEPEPNAARRSREAVLPDRPGAAPRGRP